MAGEIAPLRSAGTLTQRRVNRYRRRPVMGLGYRAWEIAGGTATAISFSGRAPGASLTAG